MSPPSSRATRPKRSRRTIASQPSTNSHQSMRPCARTSIARASSATTGSSIFDFEFDGQAEAVYGDECFTRVYEGKTGEVLYSSYRTSCTWYENPIVADVDNDRIAA